VLDHALAFDAAEDADFFAGIPAAAAVFALRGAGDAEPYVSKTADLRRRLRRLLAQPEEASRRLNLREQVRTVEYTLTGSDFESSLVLYQTLRALFPKAYASRLRLRPAPLIKFILGNEHPRVAVTTRISSLRGKSIYYGPFPTRVAAEKFANDSLDFFKIRRCTDDLHPDPAFPGCIYSEMKMCLAPCFNGCTELEYAAEVERVQAYLDSRGNSLVREMESARDKASEQLDFEAAANAHARAEKARAVARELPEIVRRIDQIDGVMIQPSAAADSVALFRISNGMIAAPVQLHIAAQTESLDKPLSMERRISDALSLAEVKSPASAIEWMEHLAILKRWYYRSNKSGEVFFAENGELPLRRVVRAVSRVFRGEKAQPDLSESSREYWVLRGKEAEQKDGG
jgi:excinuclease ABC subunit C